jgi:hypothetical protein
MTERIALLGLDEAENAAQHDALLAMDCPQEDRHAS